MTNVLMVRDPEGYHIQVFNVQTIARGRTHKQDSEAGGTHTVCGQPITDTAKGSAKPVTCHQCRVENLRWIKAHEEDQ